MCTQDQHLKKYTGKLILSTLLVQNKYKILKFDKNKSCIWKTLNLLTDADSITIAMKKKQIMEGSNFFLFL